MEFKILTHEYISQLEPEKVIIFVCDVEKSKTIEDEIHIFGRELELLERFTNVDDIYAFYFDSLDEGYDYMDKLCPTTEKRLYFKDKSIIFSMYKNGIHQTDNT